MRTLGGIDSGTSATSGARTWRAAKVDLGAFDGTPDATPDTVTLDGTAKGRARRGQAKPAKQVLVKGLPTQTTIAGSERGSTLLRGQHARR